MYLDRRYVAPTTRNLIQIKHRDTGNVIFSRESEFNTIAKTLRVALILNVNIQHADLSGADLSNGYYVGANLSYCDLSNAVLDGANLSKSIFEQTTFKKTSAIRTNFRFSTVTDVKFIKCSLKEADFGYALLDNVNFWWSYLAWAKFDKTIMNDVHGQFVDFTSVDFLTAKIKNAFIWFGNFTGAKAHSEAGFRTKKGGDTPYYKIPVVCDGPCQNCEGCESDKKGGS